MATPFSVSHYSHWTPLTRLQSLRGLGVPEVAWLRQRSRNWERPSGWCGVEGCGSCQSGRLVAAAATAISLAPFKFPRLFVYLSSHFHRLNEA